MDVSETLCSVKFCFCGKNTGKNNSNCKSLDLIQKLRSLGQFHGVQINRLNLKTWSTAIQETISKHTAKDALRNQVFRLYRMYHNDIQVSAIIQNYMCSVPVHGDACHQQEHSLITESVKTTERRSSASLLNNEENEDFRSNFIQMYKKAINVFASTPCFICDRLMYRNGVVATRLHNTTVTMLKSLEATICVPEGTVYLCHRCQRLNLKGKVSPQANCNGMRLKPTPPELEVLSDAEMALISQVKPFMKIFHLAKGRGQFAIRGSVTHFPLCVEEVIEQLPIDASKAGIIVVSEHREGIEGVKNLEVRPQKIREALDWLVRHNELYSHVQIDENAIANSGLHDVVVNNNVDNIQDIPITDPTSIGFVNFDTSNDVSSILRGSIHQKSSIFSHSFAGTQCTAMAATAIAFASLQCPLTWQAVTIDEILIRGDAYFRQQNDLRPVNVQNQFMFCDDVSGIVQNVFSGVKVRINTNLDLFWQGMLNRFNPNDRNILRLKSALERFVLSQKIFAILTVSDYSMALMRAGSRILLFDSHSRGPKGGVAASGTACMLNFTLPDGISKLAAIIHKNVQPKRISLVDENLQRLQDFAFNICTVDATLLSEQNNQEDSSDEEEYTNEVIEDPSKTTPTIFVRNGAPLVDCMIHSIDFCEPNIDDAMQAIEQTEFFLNRKSGKPINATAEIHLEELSFVKYFTEGKFGRLYPRSLKQTPLDYFQQRVMSRDRRFSTPSYVFYALCQVEEFKIKQKVHVCCDMKMQTGDRNSDYDPKNVHLVLANIRGSLSYWKQYCGSVIAMIHQLGSPTFFLTFSYDDLNSIDAMLAMIRHQSGNDDNFEDVEWETLDFDQRRKMLDNNPITAARHFNMRVNELFKIMQNFSVELFGRRLVDFTWRVEFQNRGSCHVHSLIFLENVPAVNTPEYIHLIDRNISCSIIGDTVQLARKYQSHRHTATCFKGEKVDCRFGFPRKVTDVTTILGEDEIVLNRGRFMNMKRSADEVFINNYHPILLEALQCNMDISAVTNEMSIAYYISKYMSKAEPSDIRGEMRDLLQASKQVPNENTRTELLKQTMKIMRKREVCGQEACYRLCHLPLHKSSRSTVFVPTFKPENRTRVLNKEKLRNGEEKLCPNIIEKYINRPRNSTFDPICLYEFAAIYQPVYNEKYTNIDEDLVEEINEDLEQNVSAIKLQNNLGFIKLRTKTAVVKHPNFNAVTDPERYYYSLLLLYLPFREERFLIGFQSSLEAFQQYHNQLRTQNDNSIIKIQFIQELNRCLCFLAQMQSQESSNEDVDDELINDVFEELEEHEDISDNLQVPVNTTDHLQAISTLSNEQRIVFQKVVNGICSSVPTRLVVLASGGCGKSYVIKVIHDHIQMLTAHLPSPSIILLGPTGVSAKNIGGQTVHKGLALGVEKYGAITYTSLKGKNLAALRRKYHNLKLIVIDEISMISYEMLRVIHLRLCEIFENSTPFGGMSVLLVGDLLQLKPVRGSYVFNQPHKFEHEEHLWRLFEYQELFVNHRQKDDPLLDICNSLRIGSLNQCQLELLMTRVIDPSKPNYEEMKNAFKDALRIFPTRKLTQAYNNECSNHLSKSTVVYSIKALDSYVGSMDPNATANEKHVYKDVSKCAGIPSVLKLGVGSRVMLLRNKDVSGKLVNGSMGTVTSFEWNSLRRNPRINSMELPYAIIIRFDDANSHLVQPDGNCRIMSEVFTFPGKNGNMIARTMFPLVESFAVNVHKTQSLSISKAVLDLGKKYFCAGQLYVSLSRVRSIQGLGIINLAVSKLTQNKASTEVMEELSRIQSLNTKGT